MKTKVKKIPWDEFESLEEYIVGIIKDKIKRPDEWAIVKDVFGEAKLDEIWKRNQKKETK